MYAKILINSIEDLPKIEGSFIFGWNKEDKMIQFGVSRELYDPDDDEETKAELVKVYDWYLIEQPINVPTDKDIAYEIIAEFLLNPHPNQKKNYDREKKAFANGAKWAINEVLKRNKD